MANRHLARTLAMQSLYEWDFNGKPESKLKEFAVYNLREFAPKFDDRGFVDELLDGVARHLREIDALITKYAPEWPIEQTTIVDRNILRLGIYELVYSETVPSKVAINEAIELGKTFGGEASGRFINGVLGAIYRDRLKEGKVKEVDEKPPKKEAKQKS